MSQIPSRSRGAALLVALALAACASPAESPTPPPAHVAGTVVSVLTDFVFVIDRSPAAAELLILTTDPADVSVGETVTATGQVLTFRFDRFSRPYWLPDPAPFRPFEHHQCLLAAEVRTAAL